MCFGLCWVQCWTRFWCVLLVCLGFVICKFHNFCRKSAISSIFRGLQYKIPGNDWLRNAFILLHFAWIRTIFGSKSTKFRRLVQSVTGTWPKALRTWKSMFLAKCYLDVVKTVFFVDFCRVLIEDFRRFSRIFTYFIVFAHRFERFQEANRFETRSFSGFDMDPSNFRMKIHEISAFGAKRYRNVTKSVPDVKITRFCKVLYGRAKNCIFRWFL